MAKRERNDSIAMSAAADDSGINYEFDLRNSDDTARKLLNLLETWNSTLSTQLADCAQTEFSAYMKPPPKKKQKMTATSSLEAAAGSSGNDYDADSTTGDLLSRTKSAIVRSKDRLKLLQYSEQVIEMLQDHVKEEITGLFDSMSPFLSLGRPILSHILSYLDEESLYRCELSSFALNDVIRSEGHWEVLFKMPGRHDSTQVKSTDLYITDGAKDCTSDIVKTRYRRYGKIDSKMTVCCRFFGMMALKARDIEVAGEAYYNYRSIDDQTDPTIWPEMELLQPKLLMDSGSVREILFLRISEWDIKAGRHRLAWQGFVKCKEEEGRLLETKLREVFEKMDWNELQHHTDSRRWKKARKAARHLRLTVLDAEDTNLIITTGTRRAVRDVNCPERLILYSRANARNGDEANPNKAYINLQNQHLYIFNVTG